MCNTSPLYHSKRKKKTVLAGGAEILTILLEYPPITILCADTHNYQKGKLIINGISIPQIIAGTGGADPDFINAKEGESYIVDGITYVMDEHIPGYGYLEVLNDGDKFINKFIKVENWRSFEGRGGKRKTGKKLHRLKNKTRKLILK